MNQEFQERCQHDIAMLAAMAAKDRCGGTMNGMGGGYQGALSPFDAGRAVTQAYLTALEQLTPTASKKTPAVKRRR